MDGSAVTLTNARDRRSRLETRSALADMRVLLTACTPYDAVMITLNVREPSGQVKAISANVGQSLMMAAVSNFVDGIVGECGGSCACATCHVYIDDEWQNQLKSPKDDEILLLQEVSEPRENSRLACQIKLDSSLDGLSLEVPESQY